MTNRRTAQRCILAAIVIAAAHGQNPTAKPVNNNETIVFVCQRGSAKSVVAARFFNRIAIAQGLPLRAVARGIDPEAAIPQSMREPIRSDRFEIGPDEKPVALNLGETKGAFVVVCIGNPSLGCNLPPEQSAAARRVVQWMDVPDVSAGYEAARDKILSHFKELMAVIQPGAKGK
jgi:hypothetical protein